ncbi:MAG: oligosaccharide flippase family protein [Cytophagales bacterium]|nr:oligosaccharide flippase family protein [Cytophagales bacterium]
MSFYLFKDKNFRSSLFNLVFLRIVSRVLPLFMQGYILRSAGVLSFGGLGFAKSIGYCFTTIISYGGYYVVPKYIALLPQDENYKKKIGCFFTSSIVIHLAGTFVCFLLYTILIYLVPSIYAIKDFLLWFYVVSIASAMFPLGFFQGINKMYIVSILNPITKAIIYISIPILIHTPKDAIIYPKIFAMAEVIRLIMAYIILICCFKIPIIRPKMSIITYQLKDGITNFFYDAYMLFYSHFPTIFLGVLVSREAVATYQIGDRLAKIVLDVLTPFLQSLYPIMNKLFNENINNGLVLAKKILLANCCIILPFCIICFLFSSKIVFLLGGNTLSSEVFYKAVTVLKIHSFLPLLVVTSSIVGLQIITPLHMGRYYSIILFMSSITAVVCHFLLVPQYSSIGAAYAIIIGEMNTFIGTIVILIYSLKRINYKRSS